MVEVRVTEFERVHGGKSVEYVSPYGELLAYLDYMEYQGELSASCTVFTPYNGYSRAYDNRSVEACEGIIKRHLAKLGY